jgi:hypothetical protein
MMEPYKWTDAVPEDDPEFQGLLKEEEPAAYPEVLAKLPGVELECEEEKFQVVTDESVPDFAELAAMAQNNAGIDPSKQLRQANDVVAIRLEVQAPALVEPDEDKLVYEITFYFSDAGLGNILVPPEPPLHGEEGSPGNVPFPYAYVGTAGIIPDIAPKEGPQYSPQLRRSVVRNQPYNTYALRMMFLQLGEGQVHWSVLEAMHYAGMNKNEQLHVSVQLPNGDLMLMTLSTLQMLKC